MPISPQMFDMQYLRKQYELVRRAVEDGKKISDVLTIKQYVQILMARQIAAFLPAGGTVVEVGCGGSLTLHFLSNAGFRCIGIDISPLSIEYSAFLRDYYRSKVELILGDSNNLPFPDSSIDYVFSVGLVEHYPPAEQLLICKEQARISRCYLHIEVPNPHPLSTFYTVGQESSEEHYACNPGIILNNLGFRIINIDGRCVFNELNLLSLNPSLFDFVRNINIELIKHFYNSKDIIMLVQAERTLSTCQRLLYGFQICWIGIRT